MIKIKLLSITLLAACSLSLSGCGIAPVKPGNDPVIVHAEQSIGIGTDTFTTFLDTEAKTHVALCNVSHEVCEPVHEFSENLRTPETFVNDLGITVHTRKAKHWLQTATHLLEEYKLNPNADNRDKLQRILDVISAAVAEANTYLGKAYIGKVKGK